MSSESCGAVANFVQKTFLILGTPDYASIINWLPNGREFSIHDLELFEQTVLPVHFRHGKINSFIRQLNMYGFHKSRKDPTKLIFSHSAFLQNRPDLLLQVRRKVKKEPSPCPEKSEQLQKDMEEEYTPKSSPKSQPKSYQIPHDGKQMGSEKEQTREEKETERTATKQTLFQSECRGHNDKLLPAFNSFFHLEYEGQSFVHLMPRSQTKEMHLDPLRVLEVPSLREIGTEEYLGGCSRMSIPECLRPSHRKEGLSIYELCNYSFELDI